MKRALFLSLVCAWGLALSATTPAAVAFGYPPMAALFSTGLPGAPLSAVEASSIAGGDVFMELNAERTRLRVKVYTNDDELRRLKPTPIKTFEVDAHNRIVETTKAPYMPAPGAAKANGSNLTSKPAQFPSGTSNVSAITKTSGKYGPNMISTDAVGRVEVYAKGKSVGTYSDVGYAIHSNVNDFSVSRSNGCVIVSKTANSAIAGVLRADREDASNNRPSGRSVQLFHVWERP
ncbi:MAG TPA: hypothetical protein VMV83_10295 [Rectinemataceae bacterium]|nr:hypothetical protein [Rectinemataceae bacterium]